MAMFTSDSRQFKFDVLTEICRQSFGGELKEEKVQEMARNLVSLDSPRYRCCVYKEREILRQRVRLSLGHMASDTAVYNPDQIVQVIDAACDGCTIHKITVTDNCRKCMAKSCLSACRFGAISIGTSRTQIDYDKCKECGACARACPYNAIVVTERPCYAHCPVQAISWDKNGIASINQEKCINCGQCVLSCPFGAVEDMSWVAPVIEELKSDTPVYAIVAPSIQGQFDNANLPQIMEAIRQLGFDDCLEVAAGADAVAYYEAEELVEKMKEGKPMTTSCCTAFVNMQRIHFPEQYAENKSTLVTPMMAMARKLKQEHPHHKVVFIGPCVAKKQEARAEDSAVDYVLTYEELAAMFVAKRINPEEMEGKADTVPSNFGRSFAASGGVAAAVVQALKEKGIPDVTYELANGGVECKQQLTLIKNGRFTKNILEGMSCFGGCIGGPATLASANLVKGRMVKENMANKGKTIGEALSETPFYEVDMEIRK